MVNAKDLALFKPGPHGSVDRAVGRKAVAQRLFKHHAHLGLVQPSGGQLLAHRLKQRWGSGQVHHHRVGLTLAQEIGQRSVRAGLRQVHAQVLQVGGKTRELFIAWALGQLHIGKPGGDALAVLRVCHCVARHANDATTGRQRAMAKRLKQRGHQLAPSQVTRATKQNEIERHGYSGQGHYCNLVS